MSDNIHSGHRQRMKEKFLAHGLDSFTDIEALELLLYYAIPRQNTNELAHALLDRFGSFSGVLEAEASELAKVAGVGENTALLLRLVTALNRRYMQAGNARGTVIDDSTAAGEFLLPYFAYCREECSVMLCMNSAGRVIHCHQLAEGSPGSVNLGVRQIVDLALRDKASRVILSHNHTSGTALPSNADMDVTTKLFHMLRLIDVELVDHIIVSQGDFVSMRDSGFFRQI